tara:strand:+ start:77 stop:466 length:390 start_codon:yes stop_codon:yes gene_type:complete
MNLSLMSLNIVGTEWIFIVLVVVILLFGSNRVPEVARSIGKALGEFHKGKAELEREIKAANDLAENEVKSASDIVNPSSTSSASTSPIKVDSPVKTEEDKIKKIAQDLGLNSEGKSEDEIKKEIKDSLN